MVLPYLIQKEFKQIFRNKLLPKVFVMLPIAVMLAIPNIATQEVKGLQFAVVDNDHSVYSRRFINKVDASTYLSLTAVASTYDEAMHSINSGTADVIIEIPKHYGRDVEMGLLPSVGVFANATSGTKGAMSTQYITQIFNDYTQELIKERGSSSQLSALSSQISTRYFFNPNLDYKRYMVPALFSMLLVLIVAFLPALNIVSEKEKGTIEQINVSPISKVEFIISKIVPYVIIGIFMSTEALFVAHILYGIVPAGSILAVFLYIVIFCMLVSSLGVIVSNRANTIQQAALTMFFFLVVFILMSGLLSPVQSMPQWAQYLTYLNPLRYFIEAMRFTFIKGSTIQMLMPQLLALIVYTVFGWAVAILSYRKNG